MTENEDAGRTPAERTRRNVLQTTAGLGAVAVGLGGSAGLAAADSTDARSVDLDSFDLDRNSDLVEVTERDSFGPSPDAISLEGTVTPGKGDLYGSYIWGEGHEVEINVDWDPDYENLLVGVLDRDRGEGALIEVTGGYETVTATVGWHSDQWSVIVAAPEDNTEAVSYTGNAKV